MKVFKFGGASVKDPAAIKNVSNILKGFTSEELVIVISASGKTTNALEDVINEFWNNGNPKAALEIVKKHHYGLIDELFENKQEISDKVNDKLVEIEWVLDEKNRDSYDYTYDQIVSCGEFLSTMIVSAYLNEVGITNTWLDARDVVATDDTYREAKINWEQTEKQVATKVTPLLEKGFVITQGFIGCTSENNTATLGREGSDFSAAIFSYCLNAESMSIWKDVPGVLTGDPRLFKNVLKIDQLSYREAIEMTYYGASVIHPKTIKPLQNKNIPLHVRSFIEPTGSGTVIMSSPELQEYPPCIIVKKNQMILYIATRDFSFVAEDHLSEIFTLMAKHRIKVNMTQNTAVSFSVCLDNDPKRVANLIKDLQENYKVIKDEGLELLTVRHYRNRESLLKDQENKLIILESYLSNTAQLVVKDLPKMERK